MASGQELQKNTGAAARPAANNLGTLQGLLDKYFPDLKPRRDYRPITSEELAATAVFAIEVESWSGKQKRGPE